MDPPSPYPSFPLMYACIAVVTVTALWIKFQGASRYPPGPKGVPFLGNIWDVPKDHGWFKFKEIGDTLESDIVHFGTLGAHLVVLNSARAAKEILDKQSNISSDRLRTVMIHELTGWGRAWSLMAYGDVWRIHRRLFHQNFRPTTIPLYYRKQAKAVEKLLVLLVADPMNFAKHIRFMAGAAILSVVYGFDIEPGDSRLELAEKALHEAGELVNDGFYLVDIIPILKHLPWWLPGAGFKRKAQKIRATADDFFDVPYHDWELSMTTDNARPCFLQTLISTTDIGDGSEKAVEVLKSLAAVAYAGGTDSTAATLNIFIKAMALYPCTQLAAQQELDRVLGKARLPSIEDKDALPQITAMFYEVLRWYPAVPLGVPHRATAEIEWNGYRIPSGSIIMANAWAILHDEAVYKEPDTFKPERFIKADGSLNENIPYPIEAFGYGRRVCAGRHFAHDLLWLAIAQLLTVFKIEPPSRITRLI